MKTIAFYSYKGGVGRTLALVNIANRLAEFGKKVCVMDFDLEAPGLNYKFNISEVKQGLIDYIYEFAVKGKLSDFIGKYTKEIPKYKEQNNIIFIPAGNSESGEYWKKLSRISWWNLFYEKDSEGLAFFLDLKEKIKQEFNPDYLLIDNRTGITETSSVTMTILADAIVLFAVNNEENICGTQRIIKSLTKEENNLLEIDREIHFVLTRLPQITSPTEWTRDEGIRNQIKQKMEEVFQNSDKKLNSFNVIHSNKEIALYDRVTINYDFNENNIRKDSTPSISSEYLSLFDSLTENDLSKEEKEKFNNLQRAGTLLQRAYDSFYNNDPDLLNRLDEIEKLATQLPDISLLRGRYFLNKKCYEHAIECFTKAIDLEEPLGSALFFRAASYFRLANYQEALNDCNHYISNEYGEFYIHSLSMRISINILLGEEHTKLIAECQELIEKYPNHSDFYYLLSCLYCDEKEYQLALKNIYKAIELGYDSMYLATLAEINFCMDNKLEFYRNIDEALSKKFPIESILNDTESTKNIYKQALKDPEFIRILNKHNKVYFVELLQKDADS